MTYKTILVHLNHLERAHALLGVAIDLAARFDAHLIGVHVFPAYRLHPPIRLLFADEMADRITQAIKEEAEGLQAVFVERTAHQPFSVAWRSITTERRDPALTLLEQARASDLVVTSQADPEWQFSDSLDVPERLVLGAGRPVLVVPNIGQYKALPGNVVIAWNDSREAARAVWDALPMLKAAATVTLLTFTEAGRNDASPDARASLVAALARHGVDVGIQAASPAEATVGEDIRVAAMKAFADLVVMGCYGHSRIREHALGGVTRHMLREMTTPILFSS